MIILNRGWSVTTRRQLAANPPTCAVLFPMNTWIILERVTCLRALQPCGRGGAGHPPQSLSVFAKRDEQPVSSLGRSVACKRHGQVMVMLECFLVSCNYDEEKKKRLEAGEQKIHQRWTLVSYCLLTPFPWKQRRPISFTSPHTFASQWPLEDP